MIQIIKWKSFSFWILKKHLWTTVIDVISYSLLFYRQDIPSEVNCFYNWIIFHIKSYPLENIKSPINYIHIYYISLRWSLAHTWFQVAKDTFNRRICGTIWAFELTRHVSLNPIGPAKLGPPTRVRRGGSPPSRYQLKVLK